MSVLIIFNSLCTLKTIDWVNIRRHQLIKNKRVPDMSTPLIKQQLTQNDYVILKVYKNF